MRFVAVLIAAGLGLAALPPARAAEPATAVADAKVTIPVEGVGCASCTLAVRRALKKLDGVKSVAPGPQESEAVITYDAAKVKPEQMVEAIDNVGFKAGTPVKG